MTSLSDLLHEQTTLGDADVLWLHRLIGDWQTLADLSFGDLLLYVRTGQDFTVAALCRPATATTAHISDPVGCREQASVLGHIDAAWRTGTLIVEPLPEDDSGYLEAVPVVHRGRTIAVLERRMHHSISTRLSRMESAYLESSRDVTSMIQEGAFPIEETPAGGWRGAPRVGDGMIQLNVDGSVRYASPNAMSCFHRLGHVGGLAGELLAQITTDHMLGGSEPVDEALPLVLTGRAALRVVVTSRTRTALSLRAIPLIKEGRRVGAIVLCRDITELHEGEQVLMSKDATIREIHHRVKNNLQTVSALLRMQARRIPSQDAKDALGEAIRRVATIALVHEVLSTGLGEETVDLDDLLTRAVNLTVGLAPSSREDGVRVRREGVAGVVGAKPAHTLALVVVELVANAMEHAGVPGRDAEVTVTTTRQEQGLEVVVADNGPGLPSGWRPGVAGLGTQIVEQLVRTELDGTISWEGPEEGGTRVIIRASLS